MKLYIKNNNYKIQKYKIRVNNKNINKNNISFNMNCNKINKNIKNQKNFIYKDNCIHKNYIKNTKTQKIYINKKQIN